MKTMITFGIFSLVLVPFSSLKAVESPSPNPIILNSPNVDIWVFPIEAKMLKKNVQDVEEHLTNLRADKIKKASILNNDKLKVVNEKGKTELDRIIYKTKLQIEDLSSRISRLKHIKATIDDLIADSINRYRFVYPQSSEGDSHVYKDGNGVVLIEGATDGMHIHEMEHIANSLHRGGLKFDGNHYLINQGGMTDEVAAYKSQYAFDPNSLKVYANSMIEITHVYVAELKYDNGAPVHPEYWFAYLQLQKEFF